VQCAGAPGQCFGSPALLARRTVQACGLNQVAKESRKDLSFGYQFLGEEMLPGGVREDRDTDDGAAEYQRYGKDGLYGTAFRNLIRLGRNIVHEDCDSIPDCPSRVGIRVQGYPLAKVRAYIFAGSIQTEQFPTLNKPAKNGTGLEMLLGKPTKQVQHLLKLEPLGGGTRQFKENCLE
jgi:hypothetical protein